MQNEHNIAICMYCCNNIGSINILQKGERECNENRHSTDCQQGR